MALTEDGELFSWGYNNEGQLGLGHNDSKSSPQKVNIFDVDSIACGGYYSLVLTVDGEVFSWGDNTYGQLGIGQIGGNFSTPQFITELEEIQVEYIGCGHSHAMILTNQGEMHMWGGNSDGRLGIGDFTDEPLPKKVVLPF